MVGAPDVWSYYDWVINGASDKKANRWLSEGSIREKFSKIPKDIKTMRECREHGNRIKIS